MGRVDGKVALITGGARGIGAEHARLLVNEGAKVVIGDLLDDEGCSVATQLGENGHYLSLDVTGPSSGRRAVAETVRRFGLLNVLVNNANVAGRKTVRKFELERWRHTSSPRRSADPPNRSRCPISCSTWPATNPLIRRARSSSWTAASPRTPPGKI